MNKVQMSIRSSKTLNNKIITHVQVSANLPTFVQQYQQKFSKIITQHSMTFPAFYIDYSTFLPQQYIVQNYDTQYQQIMEKNKELEKKNKQLKKKMDLLQNENLFQKRQINELRKMLNKKEKRKYSKRRTWLTKKFKCEYDGCQNKYSSQVALNSHIKKKHIDNEDSSQ